MPKNTNPTRRALQARERRKKETARFQTEQRKYIQRIREQERKASDRVYQNALKTVRGKGIYDPKSLELTKYRRARIKKVLVEYKPFLNKKEFFFVKAPPARRKEVKERAQGLQLKATNTGVFIEREGHRKATLKENKRNKELYIERSGKTKRGPRRGNRYTTVTPLASVDELDRAKDRLRELAKRLPLRNSQERLAFKIKENGNEGYSHSTFSNIELLLGYLENYNKTTAARINFYRHLELERVENSMEWVQAHPNNSRARKAALRRSRSFMSDNKGGKRG